MFRYIITYVIPYFQQNNIFNKTTLRTETIKLNNIFNTTIKTRTKFKTLNKRVTKPFPLIIEQLLIPYLKRLLILLKLNFIRDDVESHPQFNLSLTLTSIGSKFVAARKADSYFGKLKMNCKTELCSFKIFLKVALQVLFPYEENK